MSRLPLIERLDTMTTAELEAALRATARNDAQHADFLAGVDDDRGEVLRFFEDNWEALSDVAARLSDPNKGHLSEISDQPRHRPAHRLPRAAQRTPQQSGILLYFANHKPAQLQVPAAAGTADGFPSEQTLPATWFPRKAVTLHFTRDEAGIWFVMRVGTLHELLLEFWSIDGELLGPPLVVGGLPTRLPVTGSSTIDHIEIKLKEA